MPFGQVVVGPPGAGKTTYCNGMLHYFELLGRKAVVVNLDPANDHLPYTCAVNIDELVTLEAVQAELDLGPNGGLVYCMEYLGSNMDWLKKKLDPLKDDHYLIFDCPGQVELFNMHDSFARILQIMSEQWNYRLTVVNLVDSHLCSDATKFATSAISLHRKRLCEVLVHAIFDHAPRQVDMIEAYGELQFNLDFYTDGGDLTRLADVINDNKRMTRYSKLTRGLCELVDDFGLVSFATLNVQEEESMRRLVGIIDKSNGYVFAGAIKKAKGAGQSVLPTLAAAVPREWDDERIGSVQERYVREKPDDEFKAPDD